jgi:hypothetical protein
MWIGKTLDRESSIHPAVRESLRLAWTVVRLPIVVLLAICEPIVRTVLAGLALLLVMTAGFFILALPLHAFPLFGMLNVAIGLILLLGLYYALLRVLSG